MTKINKESSHAQFEANRRNAKLGGVKSEQGKAISRYNAIKHGLFCKNLLVDGESRDELLSISKALRSRYKPADEIENIFLDRAISAMWHLVRATKIETGAINAVINHEAILTLLGENKDVINASKYILGTNDIFGKIIRQDAYYERCYQRAIRELEQLQNQRNLKQQRNFELFDDEIINEELGSF